MAAVMMGWRLWRGLQTPPYRNPLFQRAIRPIPQHYQEWLDRLIITGFVILIGGMCFFSSFTLPLIFVASMSVLVLPLLGVLFSGTVFGLIWAYNISDILSVERERATYDLLCLFPWGALGANWAISAGCLYRYRAFERMNSAQRVIFAFLIAVSINIQQVQIELIYVLIYMAALITALHVDYLHSVILSLLLGLYTPIISNRRADARIWAVGLFLFFQVVTYVVSWIVGFVLLPGFYNLLGWGTLGANISLLAVQLALFYAIREGIIYMLWQKLTELLNVQSSEIDFFLSRIS
jgi:hypothetical protein